MQSAPLIWGAIDSCGHKCDARDQGFVEISWQFAARGFIYRVGVLQDIGQFCDQFDDRAESVLMGYAILLDSFYVCARIEVFAFVEVDGEI